MNFLFDNLIHVANVLYLVSYLVSDILWLRSLTVLAGLILLPYYISLALWAPVVWMSLFALINLYQIYRLLLARRPVELGEREQRLYQLAFRSLTPREFLKLLSIGEWKHAPAGSTLIKANTEPEDFVTLFEGGVSVESDGKTMATLGPGAFVGEMSFLSGVPAAADVSASEETDYFAWPMPALHSFLGKHSNIRAAWQLMIGTDLASKLRAS